MKKEKQILTPENSGFRPDQEIKISGAEFAMFDIGLMEALESRMERVFPVKFKLVGSDGEPFEGEPTEEQLQSGEVKRLLDPFQTFNPNNIVEAYTRVTPMMVEAVRAKLEVHHREAMAGNTVSYETLMAEHNAKLEVNNVEKE